jgi:hypothetical protein
MKRLLPLLLMMLATTAGAANWCRESSMPRAVYIELEGCGTAAANRIDLVRLEGEEVRPLIATALPGQPIWRAAGFRTAMSGAKICTRLCGIASSCALPTPSVETEDGGEVCVARYRLRCDQQAWKPAFDSMPSAAEIRYTREPRSAGVGDRQAGMTRAPGKVCDLGYAEKIRVSILLDGLTFAAGPFDYDKLLSAADRSVVVNGPAPRNAGGRGTNDVERRLAREQQSILRNQVTFRLEP